MAMVRAQAQRVVQGGTWVAGDEEEAAAECAARIPLAAWGDPSRSIPASFAPIFASQIWERVAMSGPGREAIYLADRSPPHRQAADGCDDQGSCGCMACLRLPPRVVRGSGSGSCRSCHTGSMPRFHVRPMLATLAT